MTLEAPAALLRPYLDTCHSAICICTMHVRIREANLYVGMLLVLHAHDDAILCPGCHLQVIRAAFLFYDQTMVARCFKRVVQALHIAQCGSCIGSSAASLRLLQQGSALLSLTLLWRTIYSYATKQS